jgi:[ribosomal protein S5]-alanine N-acetyltransferase
MFRPTIETSRLTLRPFKSEDAGEVARLCNDEAIGRYIPTLPFPYPPEAAVSWLATHQGKADAGTELILAITNKADGRLLGAIGLTIAAEHNRAELGYWLRQDEWGKGYMTEAARAMIGYGFNNLSLEVVTCHHLQPNTGSGRVMQKVGMKYEGHRRKFYHHRGQYFDIILYSILKDEFRP